MNPSLRLLVLFAGGWFSALVQATTPALTYQVVADHPHPGHPFTQGLLYHEGEVWESSGLWQRSYLQRYPLGASQPRLRQDLPSEWFAEGITLTPKGGHLLTWKAGVHAIFSNDLRITSQSFWNGEGWGLTFDGHLLLASDGSAQIRRIPLQGEPLPPLTITEQDQPLARLNELEWWNGWLVANIWLEDRLVLIDPHSGIVRAQLDLSALRQRLGNPQEAEVLNGIAALPNERQLLVTGKHWDRLFIIELESLPAHD